jgi:hypothetical protein
MERLAIMAHGCAEFLRERHVELSDECDLTICEGCGMPAQAMIADNTMWCGFCKSSKGVRKVPSCSSWSFFYKTLLSTNFFPRYHLRTLHDPSAAIAASQQVSESPRNSAHDGGVAPMTLPDNVKFLPPPFFLLLACATDFFLPLSLAMNAAPAPILHPAPAPIKANYPGLSLNEWARLRMRWYSSTPAGKAKAKAWRESSQGKAKVKTWRKSPIGVESKRKAAAKYWKSPGGHAYGLEAAKRRLRRVAEARLAFRQSISVEGHCAFTDPITGDHPCHIIARDCDVHHLRPNEIFPGDGLPRKKKTPSHCLSYAQLAHEIERNTAEDGTLLLQLLCPKHHAEVTFTGASMFGEYKRRWMAVALRKIETRVCQYESCSHPEDECTKLSDSFFFHYDHLHTANDKDVPEHQRRIEMISVMLANPRLYTMEQVWAEIAKCRLVHADCHRQITRKQHADGRISCLPRGFAEDDAALEAEIAAAPAEDDEAEVAADEDPGAEDSVNDMRDA